MKWLGEVGRVKMDGKKVLVIGGAGFIGCNTVRYFSGRGNRVLVFDNLSRRGTEENLDWLRSYGSVDFYCGDVRQPVDIEHVLSEHPDVAVIIHLAAQTAVTSSVVDPRADFEINALGTFNVLEAVRKAAISPILLYASTNKVYGGLEQLAVVEGEKRYSFRDYPNGIGENHTLDFHSPYGCSKGAADQYVRDYARIYGIRTVVFRQSCIYGYRQFGIEDQGWVAWFIAAALSDREVFVYGDGKQVRDVLFIDDLTRAYERALDCIETTAGQIYNIGGGVNNSISIWREFEPLLCRSVGKSVVAKLSDWRPGDQKIFIADIEKANRDFEWEPRIGVEQGIESLRDWIDENMALFRSLKIID